MPAKTKLISQLLEKRGIDDVDSLSPEEKATIDGYKFILSEKYLTVDLVKQFCLAQVRIIEMKFAEGDTSKDTYYKACLHVYLNILKVIEAPQAERESLERHLTQLIA